MCCQISTRLINDSVYHVSCYDVTFDVALVSNSCLSVSPRVVAAIMSFSSRKKDRLRPRFNPDIVQRGAISWQVSVDDHSLGKQVRIWSGMDER